MTLATEKYMQSTISTLDKDTGQKKPHTRFIGGICWELSYRKGSQEYVAIAPNGKTITDYSYDALLQSLRMLGHYTIEQAVKNLCDTVYKLTFDFDLGYGASLSPVSAEYAITASDNQLANYSVAIIKNDGMILAKISGYLPASADTNDYSVIQTLPVNGISQTLYLRHYPTNEQIEINQDNVESIEYDSYTGEKITE